jgi:hypothetical protein
MYCSARCRDRALQFATTQAEAWFDGDDSPSKEDFQAQRERAKRWTPDRMQARVDELSDPDV